jgi:preprotein translocase subunit YajC
MLNIGIFAQAAPAAAPVAGTEALGGSMGSILMMLGIFVIFYLVLILPESRKRKKLQKEISELKAGDKVLTAGGIHGTVDFIGEKTLYIKSLDAKFEVAKESVTAVRK